VDDVAVRLEHVDLLNGRDGLHVHLLEGRLQLLVVDARGLVDLLDVPAGGSLAAVWGEIISCQPITFLSCLSRVSLFFSV